MTLINKSSLFATSLARPQSFITKGKQRLKQHIDTVYLKNGDEFEIELFNPTQNKVLAKIELNGNSIGSGIILRPGERVFLERFLDTAKKFKFSTYEVTKEAVQVGATKNNGYVEIEFYNEWKGNSGYYYGSGTTTLGNSITYTSGTPFTYLSSPTSGTVFNTTAINTNTFYNQSLTTSNNMDNVLRKAHLTDRKIETGRTEEGSNSDQKFTHSNKTFTSYSFYNVVWRILPLTQKQITSKELNVLYCGECGAKRKKDTHKFCPHCGTKF